MQPVGGASRGSDEGHENQRKVPLRKDPREGGEQGSEGRIMAHTWEGCMLESGSNGSPVTCHNAWEQLFIPKGK